MLAPGGSAYPINVAAQRRWHEAQVQPPAPHPAPQVAARLASPDEMMRASATAGALRSFARRHGWGANPTYARGWALGRPREACVACHKDVTLTSKGLVTKHGECPGGGRAPQELPAEECGPLVETIALRMFYPGSRWGAVACYKASPVGGSFGFDCAWFWLAPGLPAAVRSDELHALIAATWTAPGDADWTWALDRLAAHRAEVARKAAVAAQAHEPRAPGAGKRKRQLAGQGSLFPA